MSESTTYLRCSECGHIEDGVCAVFFGHRCENCGARDAADIKRRRTKGKR